MSIATKLKFFIMGDESEREGAVTPVEEVNHSVPKNEDAAYTSGAQPHVSANTVDGKAIDLDAPDADAQRGVRAIQATTLTWTKTSLACFLIL